MSTKNNGEGAPLFVQPGVPTEAEVEPEEGKTREKKKELPRFAVVPHRGKGRVLGYEGEGYFLVKIPEKPPILAHRRDLTFTNNGDIKPEPKAKAKPIPTKTTRKPYRGKARREGHIKHTKIKKPPQAEPA